MRIRVYQRRRF